MTHTEHTPQWGAAGSETAVPFVENTDLKGSPFKAWSRSVYSHTWSAYCQFFSLAYFYPSGPLTCIFPKNFSRVFPVLAVANTVSCVGLQNKIGHPAHRYRQLMQVPVLSARGI